ncbi:hypothetical protein QR77_21055 [Streptomyces sp. 150FB]|uniref:hypothetical protein n=1 Tax=Streptomyces sp. 150FB TaxID=1576605 RepID=UPI0005893D46|nr:hypothetical protein [Streptomyces sp. 150FB]KIF75707.1 hypothetical protein QR77_21055 [Streptomyces sp. 150FB]
MTLLEVLVAIAVIIGVIAQHLRGEPLRAKRLLLLPLVLLIAGVAVLRDDFAHLATNDIACLVVSVVVAGGIGLAQGAALRLESQGGTLYARMPAHGLWLWGALLVSRGVIMAVAFQIDAEVSRSTSTILLLLGINRLGQAAVVLPRALASGIPFAAERDGRPFLASGPQAQRQMPPQGYGQQPYQQMPYQQRPYQQDGQQMPPQPYLDPAQQAPGAAPAQPCPNNNPGPGLLGPDLLSLRAARRNRALERRYRRR